MKAGMVFLFCFLAAAVRAKPPNVTLQDDRPSLRIQVSQTATIQCCYKALFELNVMWLVIEMLSRNESKVSVVSLYDKRIEVQKEIKDDIKCSFLKLKNARKSDVGLYQCSLNHTDLYPPLRTPGTYLQVFEPIRKTLNISEAAKNSIITVQGVLLLLCVIIPGTMLICKSKGLHELQKRKGKEEENIYEGLNLDDCTSTYQQIQRSQVQGPYQDVGNAAEEDIQLEKP